MKDIKTEKQTKILDAWEAAEKLYTWIENSQTVLILGIIKREPTLSLVYARALIERLKDLCVILKQIDSEPRNGSKTDI